MDIVTMQVFQECQADRTTAEPKLTELLKDTEKLQEALFEIEVETYGEVNVSYLWYLNIMEETKPFVSISMENLPSEFITQCHNSFQMIFNFTISVLYIIN